MKRTILFSAMVLMLSQMSFAAETIPALQQYLTDEITSVDSSLEMMPETTPAPASYDEGWFLRRVWLRLRAPMGIDAPLSIVKFQIIPSIELLVERDIPDGWAGYKPVKP